MPAVLGVTGEDITAGDVWVATGADGQIVGVLALAPGDEPGALDLNKLFVEPRHIRSGVGRVLLAHAVAEARPRGAERLTILADPNAGGFYERNRRGADRRGALGRGARPVCCRSMSSGSSRGGRRDLGPYLSGSCAASALRPRLISFWTGQPLAYPAVQKSGAAAVWFAQEAAAMRAMSTDRALRRATPLAGRTLDPQPRCPRQHRGEGRGPSRPERAARHLPSAERRAMELFARGNKAPAAAHRSARFA
jgi:hypothetical protein